MTPNELLFWLMYFHLKNKKLKERSVVVYSQEEIRQIFRFEYLKQQRLLRPVFQIKFQ
jgi:hypothetical protein